MGAAERRITRGQRQDGTRQPWRQHGAEFLDAGLEELGDRVGLPGLDAHLGGDAEKARRVDLGLRHADHVFVGHANGEMPRGFRQQLPVGVSTGIGFAERRQTIEIKPRVGEVLIRREPAHALGHERARRGRHPFDGAFEIGQRGGRRLMALAWIGTQPCAALRGGQAGAETAQIGIDRLAVGADRLLIGLRRDRQRAGAGDGAEHHRIDHRAGLARDRLEVEQQRLFRMLLHRLQ